MESGKIIILMKYKDIENEWSKQWFQFIKDNTKTIKTIKQTIQTSINYGFIWDSFKESYKLQIECTDSSVILLFEVSNIPN